MTTRMRKVDSKGRVNLGSRNARKQVLVTKQDNYSWFIEEVTNANINKVSIPNEKPLTSSIFNGIWNSFKNLFS
jgi:hypothetical protein